MNSPANSFRYRPEIDGLRAVAVLAVVIFHAGLGLPGGFIGVDVFFVISGFLITSLIVRDLERQEFSFLSFWERRARRILPALIVVVVVTLIAGWFLMLPKTYKSLGASSALQSVFLANVYFLRNTGYFAPEAETLPLLHTWSLAVEEQFYLVAPIACAGIWKLFPCKGRTRLISLVAIVCLVSFVVSVYGVAQSSPAAFYLLPARAWELLVGSLLALVPASLFIQKQWLRNLVAATGILSVLIPCFIYDDNTPFPGLFALPPVLGAALFIFANNARSNSDDSTLLGRLLASKVLVGIGLISYSLYLWHWPIFAFAKYQFVFPETIGGRLLLICLTFVVATASYWWVETPFRKLKTKTGRVRNLVVSAAILALVFFVSFTIRRMGGFPNRISSDVHRYASAASDFEYVEVAVEDIPDQLVSLGSKAKVAEVFVWGDSHAMAVLPAIAGVCQLEDLSCVVATKSSTPPVADFDSIASLIQGKHDSAPWAQAVLDHLKTSEIKQVVIVGKWNSYLNHSDASAFQSALLETVKELQSFGIQVKCMATIPSYTFNPCTVVAISHWRNRETTDELLMRKNKSQGDLREREMLAKLAAVNVEILEPLPFLHSLNRGLPFDEGGCFYRDSNHLSAYGAGKLVPMFQRMFANDKTEARVTKDLGESN